jgi:hypothetical protein
MHRAQHLRDARREDPFARLPELTTPNAAQHRALQLLEQITA